MRLCSFLNFYEVNLGIGGQFLRAAGVHQVLSHHPRGFGFAADPFQDRCGEAGSLFNGDIHPRAVEVQFAGGCSCARHSVLPCSPTFGRFAFPRKTANRLQGAI